MGKQGHSLIKDETHITCEYLAIWRSNPEPDTWALVKTQYLSVPICRGLPCLDLHKSDLLCVFIHAGLNQLVPVENLLVCCLGSRNPFPTP